MVIDDSNYFSLFQLPVTLPVDRAQLDQQYQILQKKYHPDNYAMESDSDKAIFMQKSAMINDAYRTLKDKIKAADYLVTLACANNEHHTIDDAGFLGEQFELREQLDELENQQNWQGLAQFYDQVIARHDKAYRELLTFIEQQNWQRAKMIIYKLRYFSRLITQIEQLQEQQFEL